MLIVFDDATSNSMIIYIINSPFTLIVLLLIPHRTIINRTNHGMSEVSAYGFDR